MVDFDLEYPLEKLIDKLLDICEQHVVGCMCKDCVMLERLALHIIREEDNANL